MKELPIPKEEQVNAMLEGRIYDLLREYYPIAGTDFRPCITVSRLDIESLLRQNPSKADEYFDLHGNKGVPRENVLEGEGGRYRVLWIDQGKIREQKEFADIVSAVTEHVLVDHGMF